MHKNAWVGLKKFNQKFANILLMGDAGKDSMNAYLFIHTVHKKVKPQDAEMEMDVVI